MKMRSKKIKRDILFVLSNVLCVISVILLSNPVITKNNDIATLGSTVCTEKIYCSPNVFWIVLVAIACLLINLLWIKEKQKCGLAS